MIVLFYFLSNKIIYYNYIDIIMQGGFRYKGSHTRKKRRAAGKKYKKSQRVKYR